jgi:hypothetical protein
MSNPNHPAGDEVDPSEGTLDEGAPRVDPSEDEGEEEVDPSEKPNQ